MTGLVQVIKTMPEDATERMSIVNPYAEALKIVCVTMAEIVLTALVFSLVTKGLSLDKKMETEQGLKEKKRGGAYDDNNK